jgi:hypothetical protein
MDNTKESNIELKYAVFWLSKQREIYGDDYYYVLGELMNVFDSHDEALKYVKSLNLGMMNTCTIMPIYFGMLN